MNLTLTTHEKRDVIIVHISGKLTLGAGTSALRNMVRGLVEGGARRILLNMAGVTYMDSSAIAELVAARTTVTNAGGQLKLLHLAKRVHDLLKIAKLHLVFETFEDEAMALSSFPLATKTDLDARYARLFSHFTDHSSNRNQTESPEAGWGGFEEKC